MPAKELIITSLALGDTHMEIGFLEAKDQTLDAGLMKSIALSNAKYQRQLDEVFEILEEIVDAGLLEIRNPPDALSLDPRKRLRAQAAVTPEEPDDE